MHICTVWGEMGSFSIYDSDLCNNAFWGARVSFLERSGTDVVGFVVVVNFCSRVCSVQTDKNV